MGKQHPNPNVRFVYVSGGGINGDPLYKVIYHDRMIGHTYKFGRYWRFFARQPYRGVGIATTRGRAAEALVGLVEKHPLGKEAS